LSLFSAKSLPGETEKQVKAKSKDQKAKFKRLVNELNILKNYDTIC
jgi:hypothetical protein